MASGDTILTFLPTDAGPPASNYATQDIRMDDSDQPHKVLDFDATTNESAIFQAVMPQHYGGNGITVYIHYAMSSATADTVDWDVAFERIGDGQQDLDTDGFAAVNSADDNTVPGTCGHVDIVSCAFSDGADMDSIAVGEGFRLKIFHRGWRGVQAQDYAGCGQR